MYAHIGRSLEGVCEESRTGTKLRVVALRELATKLCCERPGVGESLGPDHGLLRGGTLPSLQVHDDKGSPAGCSVLLWRGFRKRRLGQEDQRNADDTLHTCPQADQRGPVP